ncbi:MAG: arylesterase [Oleiphilaceae bacterium]|nr:arylesterase [Oleiphilaceae bacterium]
MFTGKIPQRSIKPLLLALLWLCLSLPLMASESRSLLVLGDSLSAGYGIAEDESWVSLLKERLSESHPQWEVINASVSGETTDGGLRRLDRLLDHHQPELILIQLGGNDGLRGFPHQQTRDNLAGLIERSQEAGAEVLLLGIELPPNYGRRYTEAFARQYRELAREYEVPLLPFLLEGIYDREGMMQSDDIHPTAQAQPLILDNVWEELEPMLE